MTVKEKLAAIDTKLSGLLGELHVVSEQNTDNMEYADLGLWAEDVAGLAEKVRRLAYEGENLDAA